MSNLTPKGVPLNQLLTLSRYSVPKFQRDYSWKKDQIQDFWDDMYDVYKNNTREYFFGPVVFVQKNIQDPTLIVDGQQRISTIIIVLSLIRDIIKQTEKFKNSKEVQEDVGRISELIQFKQLGVSQTFDRIIMNRNNQVFFKNFIIQEGNPTEKIRNQKPQDNEPSNIRIYDSYKRLHKKLKDNLDLNNPDELIKFIVNVTRSFQFMSITVSD